MYSSYYIRWELDTPGPFALIEEARPEQEDASDEGNNKWTIRISPILTQSRMRKVRMFHHELSLRSIQVERSLRWPSFPNVRYVLTNITKNCLFLQRNVFRTLSPLSTKCSSISTADRCATCSQISRKKVWQSKTPLLFDERFALATNNHSPSNNWRQGGSNRMRDTCSQTPRKNVCLATSECVSHITPLSIKSSCFPIDVLRATCSQTTRKKVCFLLISTDKQLASQATWNSTSITAEDLSIRS